MKSVLALLILAATALARLVVKINDRGEILGSGPCSFSHGPGISYVTSIGCYDTDVPGGAASVSGIDGGVGTFLNLNDQGQVFMQGGKFAYTLLSPVSDPPALATVAEVPEAGTWKLLAGAFFFSTVVPLILAWYARRRKRQP